MPCVLHGTPCTAVTRAHGSRECATPLTLLVLPLRYLLFERKQAARDATEQPVFRTGERTAARAHATLLHEGAT